MSVPRCGRWYCDPPHHLVVGKTQTHLPWDSWDKPYTSPPEVWFHELLRPDGQPYRDSEVRTIRWLTGRVGST